MNSPAPGWHPDPTSRHQYRYWDGDRWTDDVADGGVASTDALHEGPAAAADPNPTASDATQRVDPTRQYPVTGEQAPTSPPYYGGDHGPGQYGDHYGTGDAPPAPARKRPPTALIAALAVLAVALVGGLVYFLVRDDDDGSSDNAGDGQWRRHDDHRGRESGRQRQRERRRWRRRAPPCPTTSTARTSTSWSG